MAVIWVKGTDGKAGEGRTEVNGKNMGVVDNLKRRQKYGKEGGGGRGLCHSKKKKWDKKGEVFLQTPQTPSGHLVSPLVCRGP